MEQRLSFIEKHRLFGIIRTDSIEKALLAARAAQRAGLRLIEITFTVPEAPQVITLLRDEMPGCLVGAGTVLEVDQAQPAADAGAQFIVAPDVNPEVVRFAKERGIVVCPGTATPSEAAAALRLGADLVKVFPAALLGGPAYIRALREVLPRARLVPSGGVDATNAAQYLAAGAFALGMGTNMFPREALARQDAEAIEESVRRCIAAVAGAQ